MQMTSVIPRPICSSESFAIVQRDIDLIGNWSSSNRLKFNKDKCQWMFISKLSKNPECHAVDLFVNATINLIVSLM